MLLYNIVEDLFSLKSKLGILESKGENMGKDICWCKVLQPASDHHVLLHNRLLPANILLINLRSVSTNLFLKYCIEAHLK